MSKIQFMPWRIPRVLERCCSMVLLLLTLFPAHASAAAPVVQIRRNVYAKISWWF